MLLYACHLKRPKGQRWFSKIPARKSLLLYDTCESGSLTGDRLLTRSMERIAALEKIDDSVLEAAADLGAPAWRRFTRIVLPLSREGVMTGCALVFLLTVGLYAMPQLLGGPQTTLFSTIIGQVFAKAGDSWPLGSALSIVLLTAALAYVGLFMLLMRRRRRA